MRQMAFSMKTPPMSDDLCDLFPFYTTYFGRCHLFFILFSVPFKAAARAMKLCVQVVLSWDRQASFELEPELTVHELLLRAQDVLQQGIQGFTFQGVPLAG